MRESTSPRKRRAEESSTGPEGYLLDRQLALPSAPNGSREDFETFAPRWSRGSRIVKMATCSSLDRLRAQARWETPLIEKGDFHAPLFVSDSAGGCRAWLFGARDGRRRIARGDLQESGQKMATGSCRSKSTSAMPKSMTRRPRRVSRSSTRTATAFSRSRSSRQRFASQRSNRLRCGIISLVQAFTGLCNCWHPSGRKCDLAAPKGRVSIARGVSPWSEEPALIFFSPEGRHPSAAPSGLHRGAAAWFQGLTPLATNFRPAGAGMHWLHPQTCQQMHNPVYARERNAPLEFSFNRRRLQPLKGLPNRDFALHFHPGMNAWATEKPNSLTV